MNEKQELLPCPFCGGVGKIEDDYDHGSHFRVICENAETTDCTGSPVTDNYDYEYNAIEAWNTRHEQAKQQWLPIAEFPEDMYGELIEVYENRHGCEMFAYAFYFEDGELVYPAYCKTEEGEMEDGSYVLNIKPTHYRIPHPPEQEEV